MKKELIFELFEASIKEIKAIESLVHLYSLENTQEYISWKDTLNLLSIDTDKADT